MTANDRVTGMAKAVADTATVQLTDHQAASAVIRRVGSDMAAAGMLVRLTSMRITRAPDPTEDQAVGPYQLGGSITLTVPIWDWDLVRVMRPRPWPCGRAWRLYGQRRGHR